MLNKDILGQALYDSRKVFDGLTVDQIIAQYGSLELARLAACKADAQVIIDHFKSNIVVSIPGTGLVAGTSAVTGVSNTGTIN